MTFYRTMVVALLCAALPLKVFPEPLETEIPGVTVELLELRQSAGVLRLALRFVNTTAKEVTGAGFEYRHIALVESKTKQKYFPLQDAEGRYLAGPISDWGDGGRWWMSLPPQGDAIMWALFEPVAPGTTLTIEIPSAYPFDDVPVTEGPGSVFSAAATSSTPTGLTGKLVSAKRSEGELKLRLRLESATGVEPMNLPVVYADAFALDPATKRKYPLLKDTEGNYQAKPVTDAGDGGRLWLHTVKADVPTLMSLTFQAPPDEVTIVDIVLPHFLPFEGVAVAGLGGAATGGIAAAGKALGLEGALKELQADVTPEEIKIDLSADVLFDFDKSDLKTTAEQKLTHVVTVVGSRPGAKVTIEGHTDVRGDDAYNLALSQRRAESVRAWLVAHGVAADQLAATGAGESRPLRAGDTEEDHQANRRVAIVIRNQ